MRQIVVAYDRALGIGAGNDLLWGREMPSDLLHFQRVTRGTALIMGRKTMESIGAALPGRQNIVVSRLGFTEMPGVEVAASLDIAYDMAQGDISVIGGGMIYEQAMDDVDIIHATEVDAAFAEADTFFPEIDEEVWIRSSIDQRCADEANKYDYRFVIFRRRPEC